MDLKNPSGDRFALAALDSRVTDPGRLRAARRAALPRLSGGRMEYNSRPPALAGEFAPGSGAARRGALRGCRAATGQV